MKALPYLAGLATRHDWARHEYARLHADVVEAELAARARSMERAARVRRWLLDGTAGRVGSLRRVSASRRRPQLGCSRAAARSVRVAGGVR